MCLFNNIYRSQPSLGLFRSGNFSSAAVGVVGVVKHLVPRGAVQRVVAVVAKQFRALPDPVRGLDGHDAAEPRVVEVDELGVGLERVVDLVRQRGAIILQHLALHRDVQDLLLLFAQSDLVAVVLPVIEGLE